MSTMDITIVNNGVAVPVAGLAFNRAHSSDDQVVIVNIFHDNGDCEGFCLPFEAIKPLIQGLCVVSKHPAIAKASRGQ